MDAKTMQEIEARLKAATPGKWVTPARLSEPTRTRANSLPYTYIYAVREGGKPTAVFADFWGENEVNNASFVAQAHQDIQALLAYCRELEAKVAAEREECARLVETLDENEVAWDWPGDEGRVVDLETTIRRLVARIRAGANNGQ